MVKDGDLLSRERLCCGLTIFPLVLKRVRNYLQEECCVDVYAGTGAGGGGSAGGGMGSGGGSCGGLGATGDGGAETPSNRVMFVEESVEFHRFWSAIQFAICVPPTDDQLSVEYVSVLLALNFESSCLL